MPGRKPISVVVFDVNETLIDITTLEPFFERVLGDAAVLRLWFAELVLYAQTLTLSNIYTPFGTLAGAVLAMVGANKGIAISEDDIAELKTLFGQMPAHSDVVPALTKLRAAGFTLVTLTNSASSPSPAPIENAGIAGHFHRHFSVDAVGKFKPHAATYQMAADQMKVSTAEMCMVACHVWDTIGAQATGCQGAFIARAHNSVLAAPLVPKPDFFANDLTVLADQIIASQQRAHC
jgi:2-haloacid dehalogenase